MSACGCMNSVQLKPSSEASSVASFEFGCVAVASVWSATCIELMGAARNAQACSTQVDAVHARRDSRDSTFCTVQIAVGMFGYQKHELEGKNVSMLMPAPFSARHNGYLRNYVTSGSSLSTMRGVHLFAHMCGWPVLYGSCCTGACHRAMKPVSTTLQLHPHMCVSHFHLAARMSHVTCIQGCEISPPQSLIRLGCPAGGAKSQIVGRNLPLVALHKERYVFPFRLHVTVLSSSAEDTLFMGRLTVGTPSLHMAPSLPAPAIQQGAVAPASLPLLCIAACAYVGSPAGLPDRVAVGLHGLHPNCKWRLKLVHARQKRLPVAAPLVYVHCHVLHSMLTRQCAVQRVEETDDVVRVAIVDTGTLVCIDRRCASWSADTRRAMPLQPSLWCCRFTDWFGSEPEDCVGKPLVALAVPEESQRFVQYATTDC
jgi:hypothetical protein